MFGLMDHVRLEGTPFCKQEAYIRELVRKGVSSPRKNNAELFTCEKCKELLALFPGLEAGS